jgi:hypothetical protein
MQLLLLAGTIAGFWYTGLDFEWSSAFPQAWLPIATGAFWAYYACYAGVNRIDWRIGEAFGVLTLMLVMGLIAPPSQYAATAFDRPLIDEWLARGDALMGVYTPALAEWTANHRQVASVLAQAYGTLLPQFFLPLFALGFWYFDRQSLWEYAFHFHLCSLITVACLAIWPAACAFTYYGFDSVLDQTRFIAHFGGLRDGTITRVVMHDIEGLISFPSFHVAGAWMVTWAFRRRIAWLLPLVGVNVALTAATVMTGAHYATDLIGTGVMVAASVALYRWSGAARWIDDSGCADEPAAPGELASAA